MRLARRRLVNETLPEPQVQTEFGPPEPAISYVWQTPARRPKKQLAPPPTAEGGGGGLTPADRGRLERIVARAPEVMVKVTGRTKDLEHLRAHLSYIMRNGSLAAETEQGSTLAGHEGLKDLQKRWIDDIGLDRRRRADATLSVNMILSMPPGTDSVKVRDAVRAFALDAFEGRYDFAFVLHQDEEHPHVHLTVRSLGYDGRRLNPRKADLHHWRERFAEELRLRGVAAEATPRRTRGQVRKAERGPLRAMRERGEMARVERIAREAVVREARGEGRAERLWERRTLERQTTIRSRYKMAAEELARSPDPSDRALANRIEAFVETMPVPRLRRHILQQELTAYKERLDPGLDQRDRRKSNDKPSIKDNDRER